jgi:hypothetical protein
MELTRLISAIGQRRDSPEVETLVTELGGKTPLPSKKEGSFTAKVHDVELAWNDEVLAPGFYPPRKDGRQAIAYVTSIWFSPMGLSLSECPSALAGMSPDMPLSAWAKLPGATVSHRAIGGSRCVIPLSPLAALSVSFGKDGQTKPRWTLQVREHDRYAFVRSSARSHAFSPWDPAWPDEQADLPMGMFMAWCIERGRIGERHLRDHAALVQAVRARKMTGRDFLYRVAFCDEVWSWDVSQDTQPFAHSYLHCLCHRNSSTLGHKDRCGLDDDFMAVFSPHFKGRGLEAGDTWGNFDRFTLFLDARFRDFELTALATDLESDAQRQVTMVYREAQGQMSLLPTPQGHRTPPEPESECAALFPAVSPPTIAPLTPRLLALLGKLTTDPDVLALTDELQLGIPSVSWNTYIDAPAQGFFLDLGQPWKHERLGGAFATAKGLLQRKKVKLVQGIQFTADGYSQVSNSTGNFLLCSGFGDPLPAGFQFDEPLAAADERLGEDKFNEHTWDTYEGDGSLTRKWHMQDLEGAPKGEYLVIADYQKHRLMCLRLVMK